MGVPELTNRRFARDVPIEERLIVALDVPDRDGALRLVDRLGNSVMFYKVGLQLIFAGGIQIAQELIKDWGKKIFLDSKINDIDETVRGSIANIANMGVNFVTVHGNGDHIQAAIK